MTDVTPKHGAPDCGLYLVLPEDWTNPNFLSSFRDVFRALNASAYEKNSHVMELRVVAHDPDMDDTRKDMMMAVSALTRSQGIVFIVGGDAQMAKDLEADGVLLDDLDSAIAARELLGDDAIIGFRAGTSRMKAEKAIEAGVDYVSFADPMRGFVDPSIVQWWKMKTDIPCLVEGAMTNDNCDFFVQAGADFIDSSAYVWTHPQGPMKGIVNMAYAIDLALGVEEQDIQKTVQ